MQRAVRPSHAVFDLVVVRLTPQHGVDRGPHPPLVLFQYQAQVVGVLLGKAGIRQAEQGRDALRPGDAVVFDVPIPGAHLGGRERELQALLVAPKRFVGARAVDGDRGQVGRRGHRLELAAPGARGSE